MRPPRDATHVLLWIPPYLLEDPEDPSPRGFWALQPRNSFDAGEPAEGCPETEMDGHPDHIQGALANWAAGQIGCPVSVVRSSVIVVSRAGLRREPIYYVVPWAVA